MSIDPISKPNAASETEERGLCLQCLTENRPESHFCRKCGAPLSSFAAIGPFESVFAEGNVYRRAAEQPRRLIVVLGMWLIFGITALAGAGIAARNWDGGGTFGVLSGLGLLIISVILIGKTTMNYRNRKVPEGEHND